MSADPRVDLAEVVPLLDTFGACPVVAPEDSRIREDCHADLYEEVLWEEFQRDYPEFFMGDEEAS